MAASSIMRTMKSPFDSVKNACKYCGLELRFTKQGHVILFVPLLVYHLLAYTFVFLNYLINNVCYLQRNGQPEWDSPTAPVLQSKLSKEQKRELTSLILKKTLVTFPEENLIQLFDDLEPAERTEMIGKSFRGHIVRANCFLDLVDRVLVRPLMCLGFAWNKRYRTQHVGDPLLMSWREWLFFPFPIWGNVGLTSIIFRGKHQATMNYDHQPWQDYFRVLDNGDETGARVYLGLWTAREKTGGWFTLTVRADVEAV